ncbi:hypothetical protein VTI74DRAFT_7405 [Chaetomium olivicolor]
MSLRHVGTTKKPVLRLPINPNQWHYNPPYQKTPNSGTAATNLGNTAGQQHNIPATTGQCRMPDLPLGNTTQGTPSRRLPSRCCVTIPTAHGTTHAHLWFEIPRQSDHAQTDNSRSYIPVPKGHP